MPSLGVSAAREVERDTGRSGDCVLLVEDSRAIASLLACKIESIEGVRCRHVETLAAARELLDTRADAFFVAVLDLNLPDAPNGEVVDLVQSRGIPVVILTGSVDERQRAGFLQRRVADYVSKNNLAGVDIVARLVERMHLNRETRVLVVDDSASQRAYLGALLNAHGYQTLEAADGREALAVLVEHPEIALVITDYNMPGMDGLRMVREMRRTHSPEALGIIGVSGAMDKGILANFLKSGANDFLTKPFETEELYCRVDQNLDMLRYVREARDAANRDFLTRLYNRRYFFEQATRLHARAAAGELRLLLAMIDADHFKRINDTWGHQTGDEALVAMAGQLGRRAGREGFPARFGGEEFVCIQVLSEEADPAACLEQLRADIEAIRLHSAEGDPVPLTVSIGATTRPMGSIDEMLGIADQAVYLAKEQGRNRVVLLDGPVDVPGASGAVRAQAR